MRQILLWAASVAALTTLSLACDDPAPETVSNLQVQIQSGGAPVLNFVFVAVTKDGQRLKTVCPREENNPALQCTNQGVHIRYSKGIRRIVVKHRGHHFVDQPIHVAALEKSGNRYLMTLNMTRLAAFDDTADYTTGFDVTTGEAHFRDIAYILDTPQGPSYTVKFYIRNLNSTQDVYFLNTKRQPLHYPFVRDVLQIPLSVSDYERETYYVSDRDAMAGSLTYYPKVHASSNTIGADIVAPVLLSFFPSDTLTPEQAAQAHQILEEKMGFIHLWGGAQRLVYLPATEDKTSEIIANTVPFNTANALWMPQTELYGATDFQIMNRGESYGRLRALSAHELKTEVISYTDILVLDDLPNSLPIVGGTITETLQTPLAHVNVAAIARGTPNMALLDARNDPRIAPLLNSFVHFSVKDGMFTLEQTSLDAVNEFWSSRHPELLTPRSDTDAKGLPRLNELKFSDAIFVGAKAANVAELSTLLQSNAPHGFAVPFYYYTHFLNTNRVTEQHCMSAWQDCIEEGRDRPVCDTAMTLCMDAEGDELLSMYIDRIIHRSDFVANSFLRDALLDGIRHHIREIPVDAEFARLLNDAITVLFGDQKVRLRSSTNAEDLENFSGAGLYKSVSAYGTGATKQASEQIRKVWASVWNFKAFEERTFWNIDHQSVYMGVLVHQAFPNEAANGVLVTANLAAPLSPGMYVNVQKGETSVTNPENGVTPEIFYMSVGTKGHVAPTRLAFSSESPDVPILSDGEITTLYETALNIQRHFAGLYGAEIWENAAFELEFKFHGPERKFFVKQVRPFLLAH